LSNGRQDGYSKPIFEKIDVCWKDSEKKAERGWFPWLCLMSKGKSKIMLPRKGLQGTAKTRANGLYYVIEPRKNWLRADLLMELRWDICPQLNAGFYFFTKGRDFFSGGKKPYIPLEIPPKKRALK